MNSVSQIPLRQPDRTNSPQRLAILPSRAHCTAVTATWTTAGASSIVGVRPFGSRGSLKRSPRRACPATSGPHPCPANTPSTFWSHARRSPRAACSRSSADQRHTPSDSATWSGLNSNRSMITCLSALPGSRAPELEYLVFGVGWPHRRVMLQVPDVLGDQVDAEGHSCRCGRAPSPSARTSWPPRCRNRTLQRWSPRFAVHHDLAHSTTSSSAAAVMRPRRPRIRRHAREPVYSPHPDLLASRFLRIWSAA
jgi:hypothetical protein